MANVINKNKLLLRPSLIHSDLTAQPKPVTSHPSCLCLLHQTIPTLAIPASLHAAHYYLLHPTSVPSMLVMPQVNLPKLGTPTPPNPARPCKPSPWSGYAQWCLWYIHLGGTFSTSNAASPSTVFPCPVEPSFNHFRLSSSRMNLTFL